MTVKIHKVYFVILSRISFVKICSYVRVHIISVRHFTIVGRADTHDHLNKVSCK